MSDITELAREILNGIPLPSQVRIKANQLAQMVLDNQEHEDYFQKKYTEKCQENLRLEAKIRQEQKEKDACIIYDLLNGNNTEAAKVITDFLEKLSVLVVKAIREQKEIEESRK